MQMNYIYIYMYTQTGEVKKDSSKKVKFTLKSKVWVGINQGVYGGQAVESVMDRSNRDSVAARSKSQAKNPEFSMWYMTGEVTGMRDVGS